MWLVGWRGPFCTTSEIGLCCVHVRSGTTWSLVHFQLCRLSGTLYTPSHCFLRFIFYQYSFPIFIQLQTISDCSKLRGVMLDNAQWTFLQMSPHFSVTKKLTRAVNGRQSV